ncbi:histone-lysine N-methyltransferase SMYD3 [Trichomycterus rosablanca]|uniref:histone-lysine N-methyltransferase SMYD3 n=1 Tax=Trichomycterus rosablanca TaxID=2290929 RepID=UPI002F352573
MSRKFQRFISEKKGNGLRSTREIRAGELIYSAAPFSFCVSKPFIQSTCHSCLTRGDRMMRCSQCKMAHYCSTKCQKEAWTQHRDECRCLTLIRPKIPTDSVRLTARIIFRLLKSPTADADELYSITEHQSHLEQMSGEMRSGLVDLCSMLRIFLDSVDVSELPAGLDPLGVLARVVCNCFSISDGELQDVGVALYPSLSLLNHDCRPNCVMMFVGTKLQLRAVRDTHTAEELCISYTDVLAPRAERHAHLTQQYHFLCQCHRCNDEQSDRTLLEGEESDWMKLSDSLSHLEKLRSEHKWAELLTESQALIGSHSSAVPDTNMHMLRVLDTAMDAAISLDQYDVALQYGRRTLEPYRLHYPDPHPSRAVELLRVAKLQHYTGDVEEAERNFRQAYEVMKVTHGDEHVLLSEVRRKLDECEAELRRSSP